MIDPKTRSNIIGDSPIPNVLLRGTHSRGGYPKQKTIPSYIKEETKVGRVYLVDHTGESVEAVIVH